MEKVKWLTQRIQGLLLVAIGAFVIPFSLAMVLQITGLLKAVDGLYSSGLLIWFWVCLVVSRAAYAGAWIWLFDRTWTLGKRHDFWWFKPERNYGSDEESRDYSGMIVGGIAAIILILVFAEFAIRVYTLTFPLYLPPPTQ